MSETCDIIVIGAGIAGASLAAHLSEGHKVVVLEMEERAGFHSTGRSAATYEPNYGPAPIRALTRASHDFLVNPPAGFVDAPIMRPRATMFLIPAGQERIAETLFAESLGSVMIREDEARRRWPVLQPGYSREAILDETTADLDVDLLHQGYLKLFRSRGGRVICNAGTTAIDRPDGVWAVTTPAGKFVAPVIVDAAGAWGDAVAALAGVEPIGLQPKRRSIAVVPAPDGIDIADWPMCSDVGETWYIKPQSGRLLVSPADATPVEPHDAYADDMALAAGIDRFQQASGLEVTRVESTWGGLRTFTPDGSPACGYDPGHEGFFWLVGQGGYGIQTSAALSRVAAALVRHREIPPDISREGLTEASLSPARFRI